MPNFRIWFVLEEHDVMDVEAIDEEEAMKYFAMHKDFMEDVNFKNRVVFKEVKQIDRIEGEPITEF